MKQEANIHNPKSSTMEEEKAGYYRWDFVLKLEEKFLKQRSKIHWLKVDDGNNKTFHRAVATREAANIIREIQCRDGVVVSSAEEIKAEAENFSGIFYN